MEYKDYFTFQTLILKQVYENHVPEYLKLIVFAEVNQHYKVTKAPLYISWTTICLHPQDKFENLVHTR